MIEQIQTQANLDKVKILLVDDKPTNLNVLESILKNDQYELHRALSGAEALKLVLSNEYACILLDIRMPGMDGFQVAELIRNDPGLQHMPILFVTAEAQDRESMFRGYEKGAVDFIQKPLEPQIIRSKVLVFAELLRHRKAVEKTKELEELNSKLLVLNRKLMTANYDLEHFTHMAAHDMHEPVRRLRNLVDILHEELKDKSGNIPTLLRAINDSTSYIQSLVNDFRALSSIDYKEQERAEFDLKQLIQECLQWHEEEIKVRNIRIEFDEFPTKIKAYRALIKRCYDNLIKNALEHVKRDDFLIRFTAKKGSKNGWIFGVFNTKSNIEIDKLESIFMMHRSYNLSTRGSSGIGLAICKRIIEKHDGKIWAEPLKDSFHVQFTIGEE